MAQIKITTCLLQLQLNAADIITDFICRVGSGQLFGDVCGYVIEEKSWHWEFDLVLLSKSR